MDRIFEIINICNEVRFWGEITFIFKDGVPVRITKLEKMKIDEFRSIDDLKAQAESNRGCDEN